MTRKLCVSIETFENDDSASVAVLYGIGGSFSSGFDMNEISDEINPQTFDGTAVSNLILTILFYKNIPNNLTIIIHPYLYKSLIF